VTDKFTCIPKSKDSSLLWSSSLNDATQHLSFKTLKNHPIVRIYGNSYPCNRLWRPIGLWDVEARTFSRQWSHRWRWDCQPYASATLYSPGRSLVLISVRGRVDYRAIVRLEGLGQLKKIHLIRTRTRDLQACSIVPQPTMLPRAPPPHGNSMIYLFLMYSMAQSVALNDWTTVSNELNGLFLASP
jgi:hypothetical protein